MTFIYQGKDELYSPFPTETATDESREKEFCCNVILNKSDCTKKNKRNERKEIADEWNKNYDRIEELAKPKKIFCEKLTVKNCFAPIEKLLPRACQLAQPRFITPKYQKPAEDPFPLPGKICDWAAHRQWLAERSQPKKIFKKFCSKHNPQSCCFAKVDRDEMRRKKCPKRPRTRTIHGSLRPRSVNFQRCNVNEKNFKINEPRVCGDSQILRRRPMFKSLRCSKSTVVCKQPEKSCLKNSVNIQENCQESCCCHRSKSHENVLFKNHWRDHRNLKTS